MKKIGKLLLVILCALLLVTGCGKKEDKAKITLTKSQIKYEENAKDILNEYINIRLENDNKALREDNKALREDIKALNTKNDNLQLENENINKKLFNLYDEKDKLRDKYETLKINNETQSKEKQELKNNITLLTAEINKLKNIIKELKDKQVSYGDVHKTVNDINGHIKAFKYNPEIITCGKNKFKLNDFLNLNLIHDGKERALLFKEKQGVLPLYVVVAGVQLDLPIYKILYNI